MSWLNLLVPFATGFVKGFVDQCNRHGGAGEPAYDFQAHMAALSEYSGLPIAIRRPRSNTFILEFAGAELPVVAVLLGESINLSVCSAINFPPGGAPRSVVGALAQKNREFSGCKYDLTGGESGEFFSFDTVMGVDALTPEVFVAALREMAPWVASLDRFLREHGYAH